ncbi:transposase [Exiguobacterium sp. SH5S13]|uniref:RNA-guided endonuclease InsQ/TnpB family protein n=1 Tax=Exiguobacterium sp. SH5S13 TaxID=2510959 RepID=UPI00103A64A4|nr:RNA-guided endonuclease TnpB family protein [Exiguobacterium sp. SH5S13]TCI51400.1 transposase [Exiguobacterium sp. SH5S13]
MSQTLTVNIKLHPTKAQQATFEAMSRTYIATVNRIVSDMVAAQTMLDLTSRHVVADLPSAVKNQAIQDAKSVFRKAKKKDFRVVPFLKKPYCTWNNQNYSFDFESIAFPVIIDGKVAKAAIQADMVDPDNRNAELLAHKLGTLRITMKSNKWIAQIAVTIDTIEKTGTRVLGVDLGLKVPAVAVAEGGKTKFFGNGRQNKYVKRQFRTKRKELGQKKKPNVIKSLNNKEQRWMKDKDHKVSRKIVDFAKENKTSVIRLEKLANIRQTARTSRKHNKNLHTWSFYRLATFIMYKAKLEGIKVEYVDPAYTSQTCPSCGERNKAKDRTYTCACGFTKHRDVVGAMNIRYASVVDGHSPSA